MIMPEQREMVGALKLLDFFFPDGQSEEELDQTCKLMDALGISPAIVMAFDQTVENYRQYYPDFRKGK